MKRVMIAMCAATSLLRGCGVGNEESEAEVATAEVLQGLSGCSGVAA